MSGYDLLVELGTEEIPAGYLAPAMAALNDRLQKALSDANLERERIATWYTPRRLALAVWGLAEKQPDTVKEVVGPPVRAAYDSNGQPTRAAVGFAKGLGIEVTSLITIETKKGSYLAARQEIKGRPAGEVLTEILPPLFLGLPWPKSMRWGRGEVTFVRPVHWILAILGGEVLPMNIGAIKADRKTYGHRFLAPEAIEINSPDEYEEKLAAGLVTISFDRRVELVREEIKKAIAQAGDHLQVMPDEELVLEVANLVERPFVVMGKFDDHFLKLPADILVTAMREHQRYFAITDEKGKLAPYFIAINNTKVRDMDVVRRGHERVLRARLDDARFYFEEDTKTTLESKSRELKKVVFHTLLGTSWQKVERFSKLADFLADRLAGQINDPEVKPALLRAAVLCKCDLVSGVVGEFPALQGLMGREYARLDGESEAVAQAVYEHYLPNKAGGELPQTATGALLSLADKLDSIAGFFGVGQVPTGAADPFALRRQSLGVINIILDRGYRVSLSELIDRAIAGVGEFLTRPEAEVKAEIDEFLRLRLKNQLTAQGASSDGAEAVLALDHDDLVQAVAKVWALEEIKKRPDFTDLAVAFKRVVNIIKKFGGKEDFAPDRLVQPQEKDLLAEVRKVEEKAQDLIGTDAYQDLLAAIVGLRPMVDNFFDHVLVDDPDPEVKTNRLALLTRVARLFEMVADFSKITT